MGRRRPARTARGSRRAARLGTAPLLAPLLAMLTLVALVAPTVPAELATSAAAPARPNILFIMVDDMRADELRFMPRTRSWLAKGGTTWRNAIMPNPLCCPSRASVLTGLHSHNHRVWSHNKPYGFHAFDDRSTLAVWLQRAGYTTTYLGKYLNGYGKQPPPGSDSGRSVQYVPPGWSQWRGSIDAGLPADHPDHGSTYDFFDTTLNRHGDGYVANEGRYQSVVYGAIASRTITRLAAKPAPFFSYVSFTAPHNGGPIESDDPGQVFNTWSGRWAPIGTPARPARVVGKFDSLLTGAPGKPWFSEPATGLHSGYQRLPDISATEWRRIRSLARQRAEAVSVVDEQVGRMMRALQASGELDNTVVVFTSDNGYFLGERKIRHGKTHPYGPAGRVPLLMRGPGIPAGQTRSDPYLSIDHAPTLAAVGGVQPPYAADGVDMRPSMPGDQGWARPVLTESPPPPGQSVPLVRGIRTPRYLYTSWLSAEEELFDLSRDPLERHNVASDPAYAEVLEQLRTTLAAVKDCEGADCSPPLPDGLG